MLSSGDKEERPADLSKNLSSGTNNWMEKESEIATEELKQRFEVLLTSESLSDDEKQKLSQEMLKIIYSK